MIYRQQLQSLANSTLTDENKVPLSLLDIFKLSPDDLNSERFTLWYEDESLGEV